MTCPSQQSQCASHLAVLRFLADRRTPDATRRAVRLTPHAAAPPCADFPLEDRPIPSDRQWAAATREHDEVLADFIDHVHRVQPDHWWLSTKAGKWSPAEEALHVVIAYEIGSGAVAAPDGEGGMRMLVSPARAWLSRHLLLPLILMTKKFPRGARAPAEVVPSLPEAATLSAAVVSARLVKSAREAVDALRRSAERATPKRFVHAYFGPLDSLTTLRLLSAHTRHHTRHFARRHVR